LRHASLLAQIIILASLGAVATGFVIIGIGMALGLLGHEWRLSGFALVLLGLIVWGSSIALSATFAG
jgi:hypothetical protein